MPQEPYQIGSGFSEQELQMASFWVRNRLKVRRLGYTVLIVWCSLSWAFVVWSILDTYVISYPRESRIPLLIAQNQLTVNAMSAIAPKPIQASEVLTFTNNEGRKDLLAEITNPNMQWWLEYDYQFNLGDGELTPTTTGFILPNQSRYIGEMGYQTSSTAIGATLNLIDLRWKRVDPNLVEKNYQAFKEKRLRLEASDITHKNDLIIGSKALSQTSFLLKNPSSYGFWNVDLYVILLRAGSPVAANRINISDVKPGEERPITVNWGDTFAGISSAEVYPVVNILDPKAFLPSKEF